MREAPADDVRALYFEVVDKTKRDPEVNERALRRRASAHARVISAGGKIVSLGTIFHRAHEQGWASA